MNRQLLRSLIVDELCDDGEVDLLQAQGVSAFASAVVNNNVTALSAINTGALEDNNVTIENFFEDVIPSYSDGTFQSHFRLSRGAFEMLYNDVGSCIPSRAIPVEKKMLATLWVLGNRESYRSVADRFGWSKGTLHFVTMQVCKVLTGNVHRYVKWPVEEEFREVAEGFAKRCGFPGVIGALDGTHVPIPGPSMHRDSYINRKGFPSMQVQAVCNSKLLFTHVQTGWPGSVHDARVFRNSDLSLKLNDLPAEYHVLGDSAYPLSTHVMVPFTDNGHLTTIQKHFNKLHSSTRVDIERAFGLLKMKFRRLRYMDMLLVEDMPDFILASFILHNVCIMYDTQANYDSDEEEDDEFPEAGHTSTCGQDTSSTRSIAIQKRLEIAHLLP